MQARLEKGQIKMADTVSFRFLVLNALVLGLISTIPCASGANFLATLFHPVGQASHYRFVARITSGLMARGHTVTLLVADTYELKGFDKDDVATRIIKFKTTTSLPIKSIMNDMLSTPDQAEPGVMLTMTMFLALRDYSLQSCEDLFNNRELMIDLRKQKFDLVLLEMFVPCDPLLAEYLKVPYIAMTASPRFPAYDEDVYNMEMPSSYVPFESMGDLTDEMSFVQRIQNFIGRYVLSKLLQYLNTRPYRKLQLEHNIDPTSSIREISGRAELWLCHIDFALEFPHPTAPNWIMIAGLVAEGETKPLPQELESFVQGSGEYGVIVFSLGSTDVNLLNERMNEDFAKVFSELPQRVLWKYVGPPLHNLGNNTHLMSWLPQRDLLAHPKTKLLIYHGGLAGVYEAMHFKKPMVLIPLFADQPSVAARIAKKKMGAVLKKSTLSADVIKSTINQVLTDPSYQANVEKYGSISKDTIVSPLETAMFWIEHIVKFGGSHLKSRAGEMNFVALNSLDVIAFLLAIVLLGLYIHYLIMRACYRCITRGKTTAKPKSD
ncbi:UDP-glucuronosyltransferase 2B33-like [Lytechinus pictus]|uniref:UDP-glucuronosyltransferase 2B33-like n=1 Tax=Lytechinus pictus TaxID=7653 RepID=UPI0030BA2A43